LTIWFGGRRPSFVQILCWCVYWWARCVRFGGKRTNFTSEAMQLSTLAMQARKLPKPFWRKIWQPFLRDASTARSTKFLKRTTSSKRVKWGKHLALF
jgi:hypothetical protein